MNCLEARVYSSTSETAHSSGICLSKKKYYQKISRTTGKTLWTRSNWSGKHNPQLFICSVCHAVQGWALVCSTFSSLARFKACEATNLLWMMDCHNAPPLGQTEGQLLCQWIIQHEEGRWSPGNQCTQNQYRVKGSFCRS